MQKYLKILVEDIHSTTVATIGADGHTSFSHPHGWLF